MDNWDAVLEQADLYNKRMKEHPEENIDNLKPNPFFGEDWNVPATEEAEQVPTPVGEICLYCQESIKEGDQGFIQAYFGKESNTVPVHRECQFRQVIGSVGHQRKTCSCYGGTEEDPPELSKRDAAIAAWYEFQGLSWNHLLKEHK